MARWLIETFKPITCIFAGTQIPSLDESLRNLSLPEKRSWLATRLQQELKPFAAMATDTGPTRECPSFLFVRPSHPKSGELGRHIYFTAVYLILSFESYAEAATVAGHRDDVAAKLCQDVVSGQGLGSNLRAGVEVAFVNESGQGAAVLREWLCLVAQAFSSPDLGLLVSRNGGQSLHPCRFSEDICEDHHGDTEPLSLVELDSSTCFHGHFCERLIPRYTNLMQRNGMKLLAGQSGLQFSTVFHLDAT